MIYIEIKSRLLKILSMFLRKIRRKVN